MQAAAIFEDFVTNIREKVDYPRALLFYESTHNLKKYKFSDISTEEAIFIFHHILTKFYKSHGANESGIWFENQLRLFIWSLICYMELHRKSLPQMKQEDWSLFSRIFYVKQTILFQYQARSLLDEVAKQRKWQDKQDQLLIHIISHDPKAKWNQVAKYLWIHSKNRYIRSSKQCRERWLNHLDPSKTKSDWTINQYVTLFECVDRKGKKWALIVKALRDRRSEHSIKNKYNSIKRKQLKIYQELSQKQVCIEILKRLRRIKQLGQMNGNDQFLFGNSNVVLEEQQEKCTIIRQKFGQNKAVLKNFEAISRIRQKLQKLVVSKSVEKQKLQHCSQEGEDFSMAFAIGRQLSICDQKQIMEDEDEIFYEDSFNLNIVQVSKNIYFSNDNLKNVAQEYGYGLAEE